MAEPVYELFIHFPYRVFWNLFALVSFDAQPIINVAENSEVENAKMDSLFPAETFAIDK